MLVIEVSFLTGRFHTTPWGRNVNEAVPEWPPSPYRLLRALYDVWKRKYPEWPQERIEPLFVMLASAPPMFHLPKATAFSTRSYLSENDKNVSQRKMVFDGFAVLNPIDKVLIGWPELNPTQEQENDLNELLRSLNYFGRSESWVEAEVGRDKAGIEWNCYPTDRSGMNTNMQTISVAVPASKTEYDSKSFQIKPSTKKGKLKTVEWFEALAWTTKDMFRAGLSEPPAFRHVYYAISINSFDAVQDQRTSPHRNNVNAVMYSLESQVPPQILSAIEVAEQARAKLMGIHKKLVGNSAKVSHKFSGKNPDGTISKGHRHVYISPFDKNGDGRIDHLLIRCKEPFDQSELTSLDQLSSLWQADGKPDIRCIPVQWGTFGEIDGTKPVSRFRSETPFVPPRHYRKGRGDFGEWLANEVKREARNHGMPEPATVKPLARLKKRGHDLYWLEFRRSRKSDETRIGYGFELEFAEPVEGPFALGYGAHFGLGLFVPEKGNDGAVE